jgi:hypothetical protein
MAHNTHNARTANCLALCCCFDADVQLKDLGNGFKAQYSTAHSTKKVYHLQKEKLSGDQQEQVIQVVRPFDSTKFNFNKASEDEILTRTKQDYFRSVSCRVFINNGSVVGS